MKLIKRVAKNSIFNFLTDSVRKFITLLSIILLARYLGAEGYGRFSFVLSFTGLFAVFGDFGIGLLLKRQISREPERVNYFVSNALILKAFMNIFCFFLTMLAAYLLRYEMGTINLLVLGASFIVFQNLTPFRSVYEAFERMEYVFWTRTGKVFVRFIFILLFVYLKTSLYTLLFLYVFIELLNLIADFLVYHKKNKAPPLRD